MVFSGFFMQQSCSRENLAVSSLAMASSCFAAPPVRGKQALGLVCFSIFCFFLFQFSLSFAEENGNGDTSSQNTYLFEKNDNSPGAPFSGEPDPAAGADTFGQDAYETDDTFDQASVFDTGTTFQQKHNLHQAKDVDWVKFHVHAGETYTISILHPFYPFAFQMDMFTEDGLAHVSAANTGTITELENRMPWFFPEDGWYYLRIRHQDQQVYGEETTYHLVIKSIPPDPFDLYDDTFTQAEALRPNADTPQAHNFHAPGDVDWIKFYGIRGETYTISAINLAEDCDVVIELYRSDGTTLLQEHDEPPPPSSAETMTIVPEENGVYYVKLRHSDPEAFGEDMTYELELSSSAAFTGFIEGSVLDAVSKEPIGGADIHTNGDVTAQSFPDDGGFFMIHPPGTYTLYAEAAGYEPYSAEIIVPEAMGVVWDIEMTPLPVLVEKPHFSPLPDTYSGPVRVSILCGTEDAAIRYTTDGSTPTADSSIYQDPVPISGTTTVKARAFIWGAQNRKSEVAAGVYTIRKTAERPVFSPEPGTYTKKQTVALSCATPGADIYYTLDDSEPDEKALLYTNPIFVDESISIKARAYLEEWNPSLAVTGNFFITGMVADPVFDPAPGTYSDPVRVEIHCLTPDANIYYTCDGSEPGLSAALYKESIQVDSDTTIMARAYKTGWDASAIATGEYLVTGTCREPVFDPIPGIYETSIMISMQTQTPDAYILYTLDGSNPKEDSQEYTSPVPIHESTVIKAVAGKEGMRNSRVITGEYTVEGEISPPVFLPDPGVYVDAVDVEIVCFQPVAVVRYTTDGTEPGTASKVYTGPIPVETTRTIKAKAFVDDFSISRTTEARYTITGTVANPVFSPPPGTYTEPVTISMETETTGAFLFYTTDNSIPDENATLYTGPVYVDHTTTLAARGVLSGWKTSGITTGEYVITGTLGPPSMHPLPGTYSTPQSVRLSSSVEGATIRYTTDGTEPDETARVYTGPVPVPATTSIRARAFLSGWINSPEAQGTYEIIRTVETPFFSPVPGTYKEPVMISISCGTRGAAILYTVDGTAPDTHATPYTAPFQVEETTTIKARAYLDKWVESDVAYAEYIIPGKAEAPVILPESDVYTGPVMVEMYCDTEGAGIRYTLTDHSVTKDSDLYVNAFLIEESTTIRARAYHENHMPSDETSVHIIIQKASSGEDSGCFIRDLAPRHTGAGK